MILYGFFCSASYFFRIICPIHRLVEERKSPSQIVGLFLFWLFLAIYIILFGFCFQFVFLFGNVFRYCFLFVYNLLLQCAHFVWYNDVTRKNDLAAKEPRRIRPEGSCMGRQYPPC